MARKPTSIATARAAATVPFLPEHCVLLEAWFQAGVDFIGYNDRNWGFAPRRL
jgi:hypothetical protein